MENIEGHYNRLKNKYKLPEFSELDNEFGISAIENDRFLLREIIDRMIERFDIFSRVLEGVLQPDTSILWSLHEAKFFDEKDKESMYELYKKLMLISRKSLEVSLKRDEKEEAAFISKAFDEWKELKRGLLKFMGMMKNSWKKDIDSSEKLGYLG
jgi:hypothetical protein